MVGEINWSILDPNAPAKAAGSFQQGQANRLAMQQAEQERAANALALQSRQQAMADEQAVRQAYAQSGGDPNKLVESLRGAGLHQKAMELQGQMSAQQVAQRKAQIEEGLQRVQVLGQIAGSAQNQAAWDAARQQIAGIFGPEAVANIPAQYDPNAVAQFRNQALTAGQQLEQQWKALDYGMKQQQFGLEKQKFGFEQGKSARDFRLREAQLGMEQYKMSPEYMAQVEGAKAKAKAGAEAQVNLPQIESSVTDAIRNIEALVGQRNEKGELIKGGVKPHAGFEQTVGAGIPGLKYVPGTSAADFNARLEQLQGGAFLQAFDSLKGGGQITEIEGKKATQAITRMSTAQSEKEFVQAAEEFKGVLQRGLNNARRKAGVKSGGDAGVDTSNPLLQ